MSGKAGQIPIATCGGTAIPNSQPLFFPFYPGLKAVFPCHRALPTGQIPGDPLFSESPGEMNSPSAKDFGSSKILGRAAARFAGTLSYFRFTRILKLFLPVTVCSTAMEYLISSRPPRSLRLCRRALVWISTDSSP